MKLICLDYNWIFNRLDSVILKARLCVCQNQKSSIIQKRKRKSKWTHIHCKIAQTTRPLSRSIKFSKKRPRSTWSWFLKRRACSPTTKAASGAISGLTCCASTAVRWTQSTTVTSCTQFASSSSKASWPRTRRGSSGLNPIRSGRYGKTRSQPRHVSASARRARRITLSCWERSAWTMHLARRQLVLVRESNAVANNSCSKTCMEVSRLLLKTILSVDSWKGRENPRPISL